MELSVGLKNKNAENIAKKIIHYCITVVILGDPQISCGTDNIMFWVKTRNPFSGKVYVKGEYGKTDCSLSFNGQDYTGTGL